MHTAVGMTTDALRIAEDELSASIDTIRRLHRRGVVCSSARAAVYLRDIREVYEMQAKAVALGASGSLVDYKSDVWKPTPIHTGFVGITAEQRAEREWKGVFNAYPFWVYATRSGQTPTHFSVAAE